jgi:hypothetical protein
VCLGDFLTKSRGVVLDDASEALLIVHVGDVFPSTFHQVLLRPLLMSLFTPEKKSVDRNNVSINYVKKIQMNVIY